MGPFRAISLSSSGLGSERGFWNRHDVSDDGLRGHGGILGLVLNFVTPTRIYDDFLSLLLAVCFRLC